MKFSIFILLVGIFIPTAKGFSQRINLHVKQKKIERVFRQIEQASGYSFFYDKDLIKGAPLIDLSLENTPIAKALDIVLQNTGLSYTIHNKYIVIASTGKINTEEKQPTQISGTIVDTADRPIPAVSILNKRNKKTSKSNEAGQFSIEAMPNDVLLFSFVGFQRQEIQLTNLIPLKVVLKTETGVLDQVVVTALGIKKSSRALSYNIQELKKEELTTVPDASLVNSLSGKVAGVTINASASGIGGSTRVVMRGDKSIFGNNNALYVLDGMPLPNLFSKNSITPNGIYGGRDGGDGISNLNPEDFESVSVLTGAASAALYGSQAANGVILLTTKKGNKERTNIGISNSSTFFSPFVMPEFQNTYGTSTPGAFDSWGSKLSTPSSFNVKDFFETGSNISNTISLSTGSEKNQTYLSIASLNGRGIIPKNKMDRYNITLNNSTSFLDNKLSLDLNLMFVKLKNQNMISQGQYFNPIVPLYLFPRGDDIEKYKVYERYNPERNFKTQFWPYGPLGLSMQNPYWTTNRNFNNNDRERYVM
ncbi:MAG: TonB-dependent receptor plug domain-containing protein, partial [Sphingobacterium sp.]|nr:TonB-dependent receptor plug domain-containing protein [Sphingobacterium sp.]